MDEKKVVYKGSVQFEKLNPSIIEKAFELWLECEKMRLLNSYIYNPVTGIIEHWSKQEENNR